MTASALRILALVQGKYGRRMVENLRQHGPLGWSVEVWEAPQHLPLIIEDPDDFLPARFFPADLLLALGESPATAQLIPALARRAEARAVIAPADTTAWLPPGLAGQLQRELEALGTAVVFPRPLCTLTPTAVGYRRAARPYQDEIISAFARCFGQPELKIAVNPETKRITEVAVVRDSVCGSARFVARGLVGVSADAAEYEAGMLHAHYPCLASMVTEPIDDRLSETPYAGTDTLMHVSGYIMRDEVDHQVQDFKTPAPSLRPTAEDP